MATVSTFDQWQNDVFFTAAEEVQESADKLESVYRMWLRPRHQRSHEFQSDELFGELRTALGTAKWQLEEFEHAVSFNHESRSAEKNSVARHREFVEVIGNQISHIEKAVSDSLEERKQSLSWVQLDEEERDDLARFLSAPLQTLQETKGKYTDCGVVKAMSLSAAKGFKETVRINKDSRYVVEVAATEPCKQLDVLKRTGSSPDISSWKIVIADEVDANRKMVDMGSQVPSHASERCGFLRSIECAAKSKLFRNSYTKAKSGENLQMRRGLSKYLDLKGISRFAQGMNGLSGRSKNCFSSCSEDPKVSTVQHLVGTGGLQRHIQSSQNYMQLARSLQIIILLLLTIILVVPFVLSST